MCRLTIYRHRYEDQHKCNKIEDIIDNKSPTDQKPVNRQPASPQQSSQEQQQRQPGRVRNNSRNITLSGFLSNPLTKSASEVNIIKDGFSGVNNLFC